MPEITHEFGAGTVSSDRIHPSAHGCKYSSHFYFIILIYNIDRLWAMHIAREILLEVNIDAI